MLEINQKKNSIESIANGDGSNIFTRNCIRMNSFRADSNLVESLRSQWKNYLSDIKPYTGNFTGKGIVICAGGVEFFTCVWVNIINLRENGCMLPVEIWYDESELNEEVIGILEEYSVKCINYRDYTQLNISKYALKAFAILNSSFKEVLYLDADNNCVTDPTYLFDHPIYLKYGSVFWPDLWTTERANPIWKIINSQEYDSIEQESGQILINKEVCWEEINLCWYFNLNQEYYYKMLLGDKDTFRFAWKALRTVYYMIPTMMGYCGFTIPEKGFFGLSMVQHDFDGNIIFLHRNKLKWSITRDEEIVWKEIKRFKRNAKNKKFVPRKIVIGSSQFDFCDIDGDVDSIPFEKLFGDFEHRCLKILKELRKTGFYSRFLLHSYFAFYRPGYSEGKRENLI